MFAGPNGSGKSTLQNVIESSLLGYYFNSDEIELALKSEVGYDLSGLPFELTIPEILDSLRKFPSAALEIPAGQIVIRDRHMFVNGGEGMSYLAASLSDLMRRRLLEFGESFSLRRSCRILLKSSCSKRRELGVTAHTSTSLPQMIPR